MDADGTWRTHNAAPEALPNADAPDSAEGDDAKETSTAKPNNVALNVNSEGSSLTKVEEVRKIVDHTNMKSCGNPYCDAKIYSIFEATQAITRLLTEAEERGAAKFIENGWGKRCERKDIEDFPEIEDNPLANRCPTCEKWEQYDAWLAELQNPKKDK